MSTRFFVRLPFHHSISPIIYRFNHVRLQPHVFSIASVVNHVSRKFRLSQTAFLVVRFFLNCVFLRVRASPVVSFTNLPSLRICPIRLHIPITNSLFECLSVTTFASFLPAYLSILVFLFLSDRYFCSLRIFLFFLLNFSYLYLAPQKQLFSFFISSLFFCSLEAVSPSVNLLVFELVCLLGSTSIFPHIRFSGYLRLQMLKLLCLVLPVSCRMPVYLCAHSLVGPFARVSWYIFSCPSAFTSICYFVCVPVHFVPLD